MGSCTVPYHASEISGVETIVAQAPGFTEAKAKVRVAVPGLVEFPEAPAKYVRVGTPNNHVGTNDPCRSNPPTSRHESNHYGRATMIADVQAIAEKLVKDTGILLRINDMSLPQGGLFDIQNNWRTPHRKHRVGLNADIGFAGVRHGQCVPYSRDVLRRVIQLVTKQKPLEEGDHFHAYGK
jgi:hypothetical protein